MAFGQPDLLPLKLAEGISDDLSPVFHKDSELIGLFNHHFAKLDEAGVLPKLKERWFSEGGEDGDDEDEEDATALGYGSLLPLFLLLAAGGAAAASAALAEAYKNRRTMGQTEEQKKSLKWAHMR